MFTNNDETDEEMRGSKCSVCGVNPPAIGTMCQSCADAARGKSD